MDAKGEIFSESGQKDRGNGEMGEELISHSWGEWQNAQRKILHTAFPYVFQTLIRLIAVIKLKAIASAFTVSQY